MDRFKIGILVLLFTLTLANGEYLNLGRADANQTAKLYKNFNETFNRAYIGIPKGVLGIAEPFYGTYSEALKKIPNLKNYTKKLPAIIYMQGYKNFKLGNKIREWTTEAGYIFFAPNSYALKDRPTYNIVAPHNFLEKIHEFNLAEIDLFIKRLDELSFIDKKRMFLVGYSEGGVATARYSGDEFLGRVVLGWSCEANFFTNYPQIGAKKDTPFLNIIGRDDELFGSQSPINRGYRISGNCADALFKFTRAKVVILPNTTHNLLKNPFLKDEILNFINIYKNIKSNKKKKK